MKTEESGRTGGVYVYTRRSVLEEDEKEGRESTYLGKLGLFPSGAVFLELLRDADTHVCTSTSHTLTSDKQTTSSLASPALIPSLPLPLPILPLTLPRTGGECFQDNPFRSGIYTRLRLIEHCLKAKTWIQVYCTWMLILPAV